MIEGKLNLQFEDCKIRSFINANKKQVIKFGMESLFVQNNRLKPIFFIKLNDLFNFRAQEVQAAFIASTKNNLIEGFTYPIIESDNRLLNLFDIAFLGHNFLPFDLLDVATRNCDIHLLGKVLLRNA